MTKTAVVLAGLMLTAALVPAAAGAEEPWKFAVTPYLWGAGVNGTATVRSHEADIDKSFNDILQDLDFGFMVNIQARKGRFGLYGDLLYLKVSDTSEVVNPAGAALLTADVTMDSWVIDFGASWEATRWGAGVAGKEGFLDLYAGGRYWTMDTEIEAQSPLFAGEPTVSRGMDWVDPVVGARLVSELTPKLRLIAAADVGGFDIGDGSKLTWSASACLGWRFSPAISGWAGYKHLDVEREDDKDNSVDLALSGPVIGVSFAF